MKAFSSVIAVQRLVRIAGFTTAGKGRAAAALRASSSSRRMWVGGMGNPCSVA